MGFLFKILPVIKTGDQRKKMKTRKQNAPTQLAQGKSTQPDGAVQENEFEKLKGRLLRRLLDDAIQPELNTPLRRAANDAAALAWTTSFPLLFFPALLEEKARCARLQLQKQSYVRLRSETLLVEAA